eukprot:547996_1
MADSCPWEIYTGSFWEFQISLPLCIIFLLLLFIHTLIYEVRNRHQKSTVNAKRQFIFRLTFIILQICGMLYLFGDLFRFVIDPFTLILRRNFLCNFTVYIPKLYGPIYYGCYIIHILLRLELSFKGSFVELGKNTFISLLIITVFLTVCTIILILIFGPNPCIWDWKPSDMNVSSFSFCSFRNTGIVNIIIMSAVGCELILNMTVGIMFYVKLKKLLSLKKGHNKHSSFGFQSLAIKNTILTAIGCISTLLSYLIWIIFSRAALLYIDNCINCLVIALMFSYNKDWYNKLCRCCVKRIDAMVISNNLKQSQQELAVNNNNKEQRVEEVHSPSDSD